MGNALLRGLAAPRTIILGIGAVAESGLVFLILLAGAANQVTFLVLAVACALMLLRWRAPVLRDSIKAPADRVIICLAGAILAFYGVLYLINALAPEVQPDAAGYHLGLVSEYLRRGSFPNRVGFYEMMPQGLEMLFVPAFAFGRHSAAKLVHFAFLLATLPLLLRVGRRLQLPDWVALAAAVLYFCSPVVAVSGTAAYNDAALVFFGMATFYLLLVWRDTKDARYLVLAGVTAGFCYAIKMPGLVVLPLSLAFVAAELRTIRTRQLIPVTAAALAVIAPWMLRDLIMSGNPVAPLFNRVFPNRYFHALIETELAGGLGSLAGMKLASVPYELAVGGRLHGVLGPIFLALPLGLLALRRRAGRLCWLAALGLALPWLGNASPRFLMPALPFLALALAMSLPKPAVWLCLGLEAVACWPQVMDHYDHAHIWRLREIPWRAALRIEPEHDYLWSHLDDYKIARILEHDTKPGERIFSLISVATAYTDREVLQFWHSAQAQQLNESLRVVSTYRDEPFFEVKTDWPTRLIWGVRIRVPESYPVDWCIHDIMLFSGEYRIFNSPQWRLRASPNVWELPLALDENQATLWRTWEPIRAGMYVEANFDNPQLLSGIVMTSHTPIFHVPFEFYARGKDGWRLLTDRPDVVNRPFPDLRASAVRAIRNAGFRYILASSGEGGNGLLGAALAGHESEWGLEKAGYAGMVTLYRIP